MTTATTTLPARSAATVQLDKTGANWVQRFGIPTGTQGPAGPAGAKGGKGDTGETDVGSPGVEPYLPIQTGIVSESYLEDIADAIRVQNGLSDTYLPGEMAQAILEFPH